LKNGDVRRLVRYRLEQAYEAIEDARLLLDSERSSISIVNRAYYAMFYAVLALLQTIGKVPHKHAGAIALFDSEFVKNGPFSKEMSKDLHRTFQLRQTTDYQVAPRTGREEAAGVLEKATTFVNAITKHLKIEPAGRVGEQSPQ